MEERKRESISREIDFLCMQIGTCLNVYAYSINGSHSVREKTNFVKYITSSLSLFKPS